MVILARGFPVLLLLTAALIIPALSGANWAVAGDDSLTWLEISIYGDDGFTKESAVTGGSGTPEDPYVIENLNVSIENELIFRALITISDTTKHVVLRNITLASEAQTYSREHAIELSNCSNCVIEDVTIRGFAGISMKNSCREILVTNSTFENTASAISCTRSEDLTISHNTIIEEDMGSELIDLYECHAVHVCNNSISDGYVGVYVGACSDLHICDNDIRSCGGGVVMGSSSDSVIAGNRLEGCTYAVVLRNCQGVVMEDNELISNQNIGYDNNLDANDWSAMISETRWTILTITIVAAVVIADLVMLVPALRNRRGGEALPKTSEPSQRMHEDREEEEVAP